MADSGSEQYAGVNAGRQSRAETNSAKRGKTMKPQGRQQTAAEAGTPF